jgi:hypothetical protein
VRRRDLHRGLVALDRDQALLRPAPCRPGLTRSSMTATSAKSPMSGTTTSTGRGGRRVPAAPRRGCRRSAAGAGRARPRGRRAGARRAAARRPRSPAAARAALAHLVAERPSSPSRRRRARTGSPSRPCRSRR